MKTATIKGLFTAAFLALAINAANAQEIKPDPNYNQGFRLGFGLNGGYIPEDPFGASVGVDARLQYDLSTKTSLMLTTGYTHLFVDKPFDDLGLIPLKVGFKGFVWGNTYLFGEVGAGFPVTGDYDDTTLILSPGVGYASEHIDFSIRYEYYNDLLDAKGNEGVGQIAVRLAYGFRL
jgi:hypothetical protein